ncbi:Na+/H+ antiporter NhaD/arsenite permease-like protein [Crossiella equi]|uniref:Na+/H+ antiporter NhaD/arsenite permease-like protein n=1 Tax=Crossiella equi TaxID=130796 RepID=A0ABS5A7V6_9PSEU|nr:SLC13 family permease [Crossiella equi]MBP2472664.1 Na+/H+ antiporter NhaD/arsenite permease-like protein [Crossiella equi]
MSPEIVSILVLAAVFVGASVWSVNMGVLAFAAAFLVGTFAGGMSTDKIMDGFPGGIFVVLVGVTYLFGIARANGTTDWLVAASVRLAGGRLAVIPWVMFVVSALLTAIGAVSPAAVAIVAPIALGFAAKYRLNPLLIGIMVVHGAQAGGFSPISVYGTIVNNLVAKNNLPGSPVAVFLASLVANLVIAAIAFVVLGGLKLSTTSVTRVEDEDQRTRLNRDRVLTLLGLVVLVVLTLGFNLDVGLVAITVAVVLGLLSPGVHKTAIGQITWPTVLLICGVLTYVGVLQELGTIDYIANAVKDVGAPLLAALLLCYIGAVVSAFASSVGLLGATIPLAVPFLAAGTVGPIGMISALAVSATVVDVSPFSTNGAIVLANAEEAERERLFRRLMAYGGIIVAVAPPLLWFALVVL